jgi:hypothetical protein
MQGKKSKNQENTMRKALFFTLVFCMAAMAANAQTAPNFSGKWTLDIAKSELGQQAAMIKSQTMSIRHAGESFKVLTQVERNAPPATDGPGGGAGNGRAVAPGPMEQSYTLDGKEVSSERQTPNGPVTTKMKSEQIGNKVVVTGIYPGPNGEMKTTTTYELSADGKSLTVTRESPRGSAKHVYTKAS